MAENAQDAIKQDKSKAVDDVWVDDKWLEKETDKMFTVEGFRDKKV